MQLATYVSRIEQVIAEHQAVQMNNPPSSEKWQNASLEINRLAQLIVKAKAEAR
jgi:hypothetical protein